MVLSGLNPTMGQHFEFIFIKWSSLIGDGSELNIEQCVFRIVSFPKYVLFDLQSNRQ